MASNTVPPLVLQIAHTQRFLGYSILPMRHTFRIAGFESFFPGGKKGASAPKSDKKPGGGWGGGGGGGNKTPPGEEGPPMSMATMAMIGIGSFMLFNALGDSGGGGGREINFQEFKYQLLEPGLVPIRCTFSICRSLAHICYRWNASWW